MTTDKHYYIKKWGGGYFDVNELGHVIVKPNRQAGGDLHELIKSILEQGIEAPILIRFNGIIKDRINLLTSAFHSAIHEFKYRNLHQMVFPVKVNPQRHVVESVLEAGKDSQIGLEVGSKPELIAVLGVEKTANTILLCNGYKDAAYISLALMARKLGHRALIIIEQAYELKLVLDEAQKLGIEAEIGFRMKLSNKGSGRWQSSGGEHSKFGLFAHEIMECLQLLKKHNKAHWLKLLHFHLGSQITTIESIKKALKEATRVYTELATHCPSLCFFDVGGGLAVDYDGTKSDSDSSMNYTAEEYARDIVSFIGEACLQANIPDPVIITETGRAIVAHHSVLITEVIDVTSNPSQFNNLPDISNSEHQIINELKNLHSNLNLSTCTEAFHDVIDLKERIVEEFIYHKLSLEERAVAEKMVRTLLIKIQGLYKTLPQTPEELSILDQNLLEIYFCNFSVFQSLPDSWAIGQLFPIMPLQKLNIPPSHEAILADLTCDSDGKIDSFISNKEPKKHLHLHEYTGEPYYIGIFLVGAYQEILGGLHNLFGDTNVVHAQLGEDGKWELSRLVEGDTIEEVLNYVQFNTEKMMNQLHESIEHSLKAGRITPAESAQIKKSFKEALKSYTYLVV